MSSSVRIQLLTKDNYDSWKIQVEALLIRNDYWEYANGENSKPSDDAATISAWRRTDRKARAEIILALDPSVVHLVKKEETARGVWLKLESMFASRGPAKKATLLKSLILRKMGEKECVSEHLDSFFGAVDRLEEMDIQIHDDLLSIMLLYSLPSSFDNFRCAIESRDELPKPEQLRVKIIEEYNSRGNSQVEVMEGAMYVDRRHKSTKKRTNYQTKRNEAEVETKFKYKCFKCHTFGHKASDCKKQKEKTSETRCVESYTEPDGTVECESLTINHISDCFAVEAKRRQEWLFDSGCSAHMCNDMARFDEVLPSNQKLKLATESLTTVQGKGTVKLLACNDSRTRLIKFEDTLLVPDLRSNLISIAKLTERGCVVTFKRDIAYAVKGNEVQLTADRRGDLYYLREMDASASVVSSKNVDLYRWHERMGHLNARDLMKVLKKSGISSINTDSDLRDCDVCTKGKMVSLPFVKSSGPCNEKLRIIYSDVVGPMRVQSNGANKYFVTFIDDSTRWCEVFMLRNKSDVFAKFKIFKCQVENLTGKKIKYFHCDNGKEFVNNEFSSFLNSCGIKRRLTTAYTPQSNGIAERMNRSILEKARCLLLSSGLSASFWGEAVATACYLRNRSPTSSLNGDIPYEKWFKKKVNIEYLKTFGAKVHVLNKEPGKDKFAARSSPGIFVGYPAESSGYKVWIPESRKVVMSRDVRFQEGKISEGDSDTLLKSFSEPQCESSSSPIVKNTVEFFQTEENPNDSLMDRHWNIDETQPNVPINNESGTTHSPADISSFSNDSGGNTNVERNITVKRGPGRPRIERGHVGHPRKVYNMVEVRDTDIDRSETSSDEYVDTDDVAGVIETTLKQALRSDEKAQWEDAILSEIRSLVKNDTWEIVKKPFDRNVVGSRYVLTTKLHVDKTEKKKARLVAKGYSQQQGLDYHKTFSPVARIATIRLLIALSIEMGMEIDQIDINTAYLNGDLNEKVYMKMPELLQDSLNKLIKLDGAKSAVGTKAVKMLENIKEGGDTCLLKKSLYGLKQAGRQWNIKLDSKLKEMGLNPTVNEPCLYYKQIKGRMDLFVAIYVDDILIASQHRDVIDKFKQELAKKFELKDFGPATYCLGIDIRRNGNSYHLSQEKYINDILKRFAMEDCNPVKTPMEVGHTVMSAEKKVEEKRFPYRELIGALMYLSVATRPEIANATAKLAQFAENPQEIHWKAAKRILRYLKGTITHGLLYKSTGLCIQGYADADWGSCSIDRRSFTGYVFVLGGAAISWTSQKQRIVATSTCEAEFVSLAEGMKEAVYLNSLLKELSLHQFAKVRMHADNLSAICLAEDHGMYHAKSKHIDIRNFFVRDVLRDNKCITLEYLATDKMLADILTKPLPRVRHELLTAALGLCSIKS